MSAVTRLQWWTRGNEPVKVYVVCKDPAWQMWLFWPCFWLVWCRVIISALADRSGRGVNLFWQAALSDTK
jgi:hypothetical protein